MIMVNSKANIYMKGDNSKRSATLSKEWSDGHSTGPHYYTSLVQCHKNVYNIFLLLLFLLLFKTSTEVPTQHSQYIYFIKISAAFGYTRYSIFW